MKEAKQCDCKRCRSLKEIKMNKPLKNKIFYGVNHSDKEDNKKLWDKGLRVGSGDMFWSDDVKSAVGWLIDELTKRSFGSHLIYNKIISFVLEKINEAFEDVK